MQLSIKETYDIAIASGFDPAHAIRMVAIAMAESGLNTDAVGHNGPTEGCPDGSRDRGILQWNDCYHPDITDAMAFSPQESFHLAFIKTGSGADYTMWTTYNTGVYSKYVPEVEQTVNPTPKEISTVSIDVPEQWIIDVSKATNVPVPEAINTGSANRKYTVEAGDTLWGIAEKFVGDGARYHEIYELNKDVIGADPNLITVGESLQLPSNWYS